LKVWYNSIPINSQKLLTELIGLHYTETYKPRIRILILKSIEILGSLKHVTNLILQIRYMGVLQVGALTTSALTTSQPDASSQRGSSTAIGRVTAPGHARD
jgi:hypothetical protein